jgi:heme exporter protein B
VYQPPVEPPVEQSVTAGGWFSQALSVLGKDVRSEIRSAAAAMAIAMFALVTLVLVSYGIGQATLQAEVQASLLWTVLFFASSVGLARTFVKEEETKTAIALRMSARPSVVFGGKLIFNCLLMVVLAALLVPLFLILMTVEVQSPLVLAGMVGMGVIGLAGGSTIVAAIIAKAQVKGPLFGALAFPILVPLLLLLVRGTALALEGTAWSDVSSYMLGLVGFTGAMITASFLLFDAVWES